jgi:hypothetical protein
LKPGEFDAFAKKFSVDFTTLERVVFILPTGPTALDPLPDLHPTAMSAVAVVTFSKAFDADAVLKSVFTAGRPKAYRGRTYQFDEDTWSGAFVLPGGRSFVVGAEDSLVWLMDRLDRDAAGGPLTPARAEATRHTAFAALNPNAVVPAAAVPEPLRALAEATRVCLSVDLGKQSKTELALHYPDPAAAAKGAAALRAAVGLAREKVRGLEGELRAVVDRPAAADRKLGPGELPPRFAALAGLGFLGRIDRAFAGLPVETTGAAVRAAAAFDLPSGGLPLVAAAGGVTVLGRSANATFQYVGDAIRPPGAGPTPQDVRLRTIAAALDAYHADRGHYPPAFTAAKDGTPLLSWRVAVLPYLGEKALFDQFKQDEPWDSLHNKRLLDKMPAAFNRPYAYPKNYGRTNARAVTGPGTPLGGKKADLGGANLLLAFEGGPQVWWSKPADVPYLPGKVPAVFDGWNGASVHAVFADGSTRTLTKQLDEAHLPALVARPGK